MLPSDSVFERLRGALVVSCQAEPPSPFNSPERVADFARCAVMGGAAGIRTCGIEKTRAVLSAVDLPVIGLTKGVFPDGTVCITGSFDDFKDLASLGVHIIAVDGTPRRRAGGLTGPEYIARLRELYPGQLLMADIATLEDAIACREAGAHCVSTTLAGYTPETLSQASEGPSLQLLRACKAALDCPVFAEGRYNTPADAAEAIRSGAFSVVVGSAITRPQVITGWFAKAISDV